jgi:thymidine kinase
MFLETPASGKKRGWIEVICGSMFSGKTEELIRRLKRSELARQKIAIFKPVTDQRYHPLNIVSHQGNQIVSTPVASSSSMLLLTSDTEVVGIDEGQFFDDGLPAVCKQLADSGIRVIVAGLDLDFTGQPFGPMPALMATAEYVTKVHAICLQCGNLAYVSHRTAENKNLVLLGETESYRPLCRQCFNSTFEMHV